jgi:putative DNA methylase
MVRVLLDDATSLNKLADEKFDLIVTDPPYRDDVAYAELSDFYYVWLKRALSDGNLEARFHGEALMYNTQWESLAPQEISYSEGRLKYFGIGDGIDHYRWLLSRAFKRMSSAVKDGGLIVTYFAHSNPKAWIELVEAGWRGAGLMVTGAWALISESGERVMARGKTSLESSIVVAWRARDGGRVAGYSEARERARQRAREALENAEKIGLGGLDLLLAVMTACLSEFTSYDKVARFGGALSSSDIVAESYRIAVEVLVGEESRHIKSADALAYITIRRLFARLPGWGWSLSSQDIITLGYGLHTSGEGEAEKLDEMLTRNRIVVKTDGNRKGAKVAKPSKFIFLSPRDSKPDSIKEVLSLRKIDLVELGVFDEGKVKPLTTSIDVLHILEYAVHRGIDYFKDVYSRLMVKYPALTEEAIYVAKALSRIVGDPEADLCRDIIRNIYGG